MVLEFEKTTDSEFGDLPPGADFKGPRSAAPRRKATSTTAKTTGAVPWTEIEESLNATYMMAGGFLMLTPRVPDRVRPVGQALMMNAEQCTGAWIEAAKKNPKLAKALTKFVSGSAYAGLISAHMPIVLAVAMALNPRIVPMETPDKQPDEEQKPETDNVSPLFNLADVGM
jgi:hypothetical protein